MAWLGQRLQKGCAPQTTEEEEGRLFVDGTGSAELAGIPTQTYPSLKVGYMIQIRGVDSGTSLGLT